MKLHNTLGNKSDELRPLENNIVKLYTCGLTVYSQPHIGNWVAYIYWDLLQRVLTASGYDVIRVQNITDVGHLTDDGDNGEDKMEKGAKREGKTAWDVAERYIAIADDEAYNQLGLLRPAHIPRATEYIPQQIAFVEELEKKGFTYLIDDGVYFDTSRLKNYGELARLDIEGLQAGARIADTGKKNPTDFAVWKLSPEGEKRDMEWDSPWGKGFPGWHLECSVMAREILGDQIDIHTGGIDHIPIHHTNEIAQTEAVTNKKFSQLWVHANHMKVDGTKMSKSLGNIYTLADIRKRGYSMDAFKLFVLSKHYRTEGNFTWDILEAAQNRLNNWKNSADLYWQLDSDPATTPLNNSDLLEVLEDDLNTPEAFAHIDSALKEGLSHVSLKQLIDQIESLFGVQILDADISEEQKNLLKKRLDARSAKDWTVSDELRDALLEQGITIKDNGNNQIWQRSR